MEIEAPFEGLLPIVMHLSMLSRGRGRAGVAFGGEGGVPGYGEGGELSLVDV